MAAIVGIDLGSHSVKVAHLSGRKADDFEVTAYFQVALPPAMSETGEALPLDERYRVALAELSDQGALEGSVFVTGLPGDAASMRTLTFPFSDERKIEQSIPFELEAEIPFDIDDVVYSWTVLGEKRVQHIEVSGEVRAPLTEVMVCFAQKKDMDAHLELLAEVGVDPRRVHFDALALVDLYESVFRPAHEASLALEQPVMTPGGTVLQDGPDAPEPAVAMVDIGHRQTSVCIVAKDRVIGAHTILHGGADATRQLARQIGISLQDAERGKRKEAFIEVRGAEAQFQEQRRISDILKKSYSPIMRRMRQVFQAAVSSSRVRVVKIILTGGGSRIMNLDRYMADVLNVHTERGRDIATRMGAALPLYPDEDGPGQNDEAPEAATALAYALSGVMGDKSRSQIDFRSGDYGWRGEFDFVMERAASLGVWALVIFLTILFSFGVRSYTLGNEADALVDKRIAACEKIVGRRVEAASECLNIINSKINGEAGFVLPTDSAADLYLEVSRRIPSKDVMERKVTELDVGDERIRIKGHTSDFDSVDKIDAALKGGRCFAEVDKGKARSVNEKIEFNFVVKLDCNLKPEGAELTETVPSGGTPRALPVAPPPDEGKDVKPAARASAKPPPLVPPTAANSAADARQKRVDEARERARESARLRAERARERAAATTLTPEEKKRRIEEQSEGVRRIQKQLGVDPERVGSPQSRSRGSVMPRLPGMKRPARAAQPGGVR